jgi:predicted negative regulator of RcsB-dependent stress response
MSVFQMSRTQEEEADAYGISLMARSGYTPDAASQVWKQLIEERKASAAQRDKRYRDRSASLVSTHPPTEDRMKDLADTAAYLAKRSDQGSTDRRDEWLAAVAPYRAMLLDEQIKLNDPGASLYLVKSLAEDGWNGLLRYNEGEVYRMRGEAGDQEKAAEAYAAATAFTDAPPEPGAPMATHCSRPESRRRTLRPESLPRTESRCEGRGTGPLHAGSVMARP